MPAVIAPGLGRNAQFTTELTCGLHRIEGVVVGQYISAVVQPPGMLVTGIQLHLAQIGLRIGVGLDITNVFGKFPRAHIGGLLLLLPRLLAHLADGFGGWPCNLRTLHDALAGDAAHLEVVAGYRGLPSSAAYGASKAALINMCEALKFDLDRTGVRIQLIDPGFVRTPLTDRNPFPMPFLMEPEEAAERMVRGLASPRFEITFPKRFTWQLKLLRILPYALYFPLVRRITGW